jgi:alkylhydroperoxidase/carboxymuconolactone decarboxylase family protein YurZ
MAARLPDHYESFKKRHGAVVEAHQALSARCHEAGPLTERERRLAKLAVAVGSRHEGAVHAQVRQALEAKIEPDAIRHVAILAIPTLGFPAAMAALSWIEDLLAQR